MGYKKAQDALPPYRSISREKPFTSRKRKPINFHGVPKHKPGKPSAPETATSSHNTVTVQLSPSWPDSISGLSKRYTKSSAPRKTAEKTNEAPGETPALFLFPNEKEDAFALASPYTVSR